MAWLPLGACGRVSLLPLTAGSMGQTDVCFWSLCPAQGLALRVFVEQRSEGGRSTCVSGVEKALYFCYDGAVVSGVPGECDLGCGPGSLLAFLGEVAGPGEQGRVFAGTFSPGFGCACGGVRTALRGAPVDEQGLQRVERVRGILPDVILSACTSRSPPASSRSKQTCCR